MSAGDAAVVCHVRGRGPLCVVHPGEPGAHWEYLRMPLVERGLTMAYLEPGPAEVPDRVEQLHAVVEELADGPVFVLGHGTGGFVAQAYALRHPALVAGLLLYATGPAGGDLSAITAPTMIAAGLHDLDLGARLHTAIPGSSLVRFEQSGCPAHEEEAERFAHLVLEFVARRSAGVRTGYDRHRFDSAGSPAGQVFVKSNFTGAD